MIPPGCEPRCPGCAHRELSASESGSRKAEWLRRALGQWEPALEPLRAPKEERRWGYRDKTLLHAARARGRWELGLLRDEEVIPIPRCPVHTPRVRRALALSEGLAEMNLRFVAISGALMTWVLKSRPEARLNAALEAEAARLEPFFREAGLAGVYANFNPSAGRRVFSSRGWKLLWGEPAVVGPGGLRHGPQSFHQLIPELFENALEESASWLAPAEGDFVLDLYSGLGTTVRRWKSLGAESIGVELLGEAVSLAPESLLQGRVSERIPQLERRLMDWRSASGRTRPGSLSVFANPPRTGIEAEVLRWLGQEGKIPRPRRIAYLSCSAGTLARDLSKLSDCAYRVRRIIPYDFFPQTAHVETLALLELDSADGIPPADPGERLRRPE